MSKKKSEAEKPPSKAMQKAADKAAVTALSDMMKEFMENYQASGIGFDVDKLRERIEAAQNKPTAREVAGRPTNNRINLIELFLAKAHLPHLPSKMLAKYFGVNEVNVRLAISKYELDTKHTLERIKGVVTKFAALPIREEFRSSVNLHHETEEEIKTINVTLKTLRDPNTGLLYKNYLEDVSSDYYIKALKEAEAKKIKLLSVITNMRSKVLQYFEYDQFISEVLNVVTKHAGVESAQIITNKLENFLDVYGFGTKLPENEQKALPPAKN